MYKFALEMSDKQRFHGDFKEINFIVLTFIEV